jgi:hypothetical protein
MAKSSTVISIAIIMLLLALAPSIEGKPTGKHNTSTGCTCHYGGSATPGHNFPSTYTPGQLYNIQITIQGGVPGAQGGFSLDVDKGTYSNSGPEVSFQGTSATHTNPGSRSWSFDWTAPPAGSGPVSVALATLTANGDNSNNNDAWGTTTHTINELVSNQPPSASNVQVFSSSTSSKTNVVEDTAIVISYTYSDTENDPEVTADSEIRWYKDNVVQQMYNEYNTLPASAISAGESWHATVAPHDGTSLGNAVQSNSITVDAALIPNNVPTVSDYEITAATAGSNVPVNEDLWLGYVYDDSDGNSESGTTIRWFKDNVEQAVWNDVTTVPSSATSIGDSWNAKITPSDGIDMGTTYETTAIAIIDIDSDGDGVFNENDAFPNDPAETVDSDSDGVGDNSDAFPNDAAETMDSDLDGVGDNADAFPNDATETLDSDGDEVGDNADAFPNDASETLDSDGDTVGDNTDVFPNDANETMDSDLDGVGDNADAFPNDANETMDTDEDGVGDNADAFPNDPAETMDSDADTVGDNADAFPTDATETMDTDEDGVGDNADVFPTDATETTDSDADGVGDNADAFPNDASETLDSDGDGVGDNAQAVAEAKAAELAAEQRQMYMMIGIAAVVIILSLAAVMFFIKKNDGDEPVLTTKEYDTPQPLPQTQPVSPQPVAEVVVASEVQRWTDAEGHTWRTMSDETTQWWNGSDWLQR